MIMEKRVAVVTGANRGIGLEVSRQLADDGLCVVMTGRNESEGMTARDSLDTDGRDVRFHQLDVTNDADVTSLAGYLEQAFGRLEASVLNVSLERIRLTMEVNFYGALRVCQGMAALLCKSGAGRVVNVSSGLGQLD
jgi:NAD(P)-dependent dehydrogenase (short-subunit alcohol dehydrogenase family)